jgi:hypothetical protein
VARVHAIFRLPPDLNHPRPFAYVEWPFTQPVPTLDMYIVSAPSGRSSAAIVPMQCICRGCHLIPHYGKKIDPTLSADNSLVRCRRFYVSDFFRLVHVPIL